MDGGGEETSGAPDVLEGEMSSITEKSFSETIASPEGALVIGVPPGIEAPPGVGASSDPPEAKP